MVKSSVVGYAVAFYNNNVSSHNDYRAFDNYAVPFDCYTATSIENYFTFCTTFSSFEYVLITSYNDPLSFDDDFFYLNKNKATFEGNITVYEKFLM